MTRRKRLSTPDPAAGLREYEDVPHRNFHQDPGASPRSITSAAAHQEQGGGRCGGIGSNRTLPNDRQFQSRTGPAARARFADTAPRPSSASNSSPSKRTRDVWARALSSAPKRFADPLVRLVDGLEVVMPRRRHGTALHVGAKPNRRVDEDQIELRGIVPHLFLHLRRRVRRASRLRSS